jgi:glycosyltransferase involved in cell wall biosynthesis
MSATPLLTVIIPAFNAAEYVREAIESALGNGFADIEVLVIDDASTDDTAARAASIRHPAVRIERKADNLGVGRTRRRAVELARGRLLAMLDADDVAVHGRFAAQVQRLETHDGPDIIGGGIEFFGDAEGRLLFPRNDAQIRAGLMFFDLPVCNGAACMKAQPLRDGRVHYGSAPGAEDYALWADALIAGLQFENLAAVVTRVRRHPQSLTRRARETVVAEGRAVRGRIVAHLLPALSPAEQTALVAALSVNLGGGQRWIDGVCAMARACAYAPGIAGIDADYFVGLLEANLLRLIGHAQGTGAIDNDTLEMLTETNADFERWRNMHNGALDQRIMALFA